MQKNRMRTVSIQGGRPVVQDAPKGLAFTLGAVLRKVSIRLAGCLALVFAVATAQAADITFLPAVNITGADSDIIASGTLCYAYAWNGASGSVTINGVSFTGTTTVNGTIDGNVSLTQSGFYNGGNPMSAASSLPVAYKNLLGGVAYDGSSTATVTLRNLTVGHQYAVQIWANDSRNGSSGGTTVSGGAGGAVYVDYNVTAVTGGVGQFTVGVFVASATNQQVTLQGGQSYLNALQVREVTVGPADAGTSSVVTSLGSVPADNTATITVTLKDAIGLPITNKVVTLMSSRGATDTISAASGPSSASGVVTFTVTSTTLGTAVFSATDVTDGNLAITQTATVTFVSLVIGEQQFNAGNVLPSPIIAVTGDLLETSVSSVTGEVTGQNPRNGTTGTASENSTQNPAAIGLSAVTYTLNLTSNPFGYDITEIRLFSGWLDGRSGQSYSISYSLASAPSTFVDLGTVSALKSNGSLLTRTYGAPGAKILQGVAALKFTMIDNGLAGTGTVFREIDVLGSATRLKGTMFRFY